MKLKLACADFTFPLLPHDDALSLIATLGVRGVDIGLFESRSHLQPSDQFKNVGRSARRLKKKLDSRGLKAADVFLIMAGDVASYAVNHPQASRRRKARDWFERTLEYAAICESKHVTTTPGVFFDGHSKAGSLALAREELAWRVERAKSYRITLGVEPHLGSFVPRPKSALRFIPTVPGLTYTLDYGHFACQGIPDGEVEPLVAFASHFHVRGACRGWLQASFENNTVDFARILEVMNETGYRGYLGLEYVWTVWGKCNMVDNLSETILFRDYLLNLQRGSQGGES